MHRRLSQAIDYAKKLQVCFIYSTNDKRIYEFDVQYGRGNYILDYPISEERYGKLFLSQDNLNTGKKIQHKLLML